MVSEVIFPLIGGIFGLKRWSKISGLEIIRGIYESKEKAIFSFLRVSMLLFVSCVA